jgi:glycolate oxidase
MTFDTMAIANETIIANSENSFFNGLNAMMSAVSLKALGVVVIHFLSAAFGIYLIFKLKDMLLNMIGINSDVDASSEAEIEDQLNILKESFKENGSIDFIVAQNEEEGKKLWFARRNASPATMVYGTKKLNEDISVPRSKLPEALDEIYKIGEKYGFQVPCFGHAGDGNIHVNVMVKDKTNEKEMADGHKAIEEIFQLVVDMGGTLSGEHGIGISKAPFMNIAFTEAEMNLFRSIKKAFDPNNILNPFKMGL